MGESVWVPPRRFYRYFDASGGIATLKGLEVRFSDLSKLNDPFECSPIVDFSRITEDEKQDYIRSLPATELNWKRTQPNITFDQYVRAVAHGRKLDPSNINFREPMAKHLQILCGSESDNLVLLWSYYAASHSGLVIEFDLVQMPFSGLIEAHMVCDVNYMDMRSIFYHRMMDLTGLQQQVMSVLYTKASIWKHEQEVRVILPVGNRLDTWVQMRDVGGYERAHLTLSAKSIKRVVVGNNISLKDLAEVKTLLSASVFEHVQIQQAQLSSAEYHLVKVDI